MKEEKEDRSGEGELEEKCGEIRGTENSVLFLGGRPVPQQRSEQRKQQRQTEMGRKGWGRGNVRHKREHKRKRAR